MFKYILTLVILLFSMDSPAQEFIMYKLKDQIIVNGKECECYVFNEDTINCRSEFTREMKWLEFEWYGTKRIELDDSLKKNFSQAISFKFLICESNFTNGIKDGIQKEYHLPKIKQQKDFREQDLYKITNYQHGVKDSTEIIFHNWAHKGYETIICWNQGIAEEVQIHKNDSIKLITQMESGSQINSFIFFEDEEIIYKWRNASRNQENFIIKIDSCGLETETFKTKITEVVPDHLFQLFVKAL